MKKRKKTDERNLTFLGESLAEVQNSSQRLANTSKH